MFCSKCGKELAENAEFCSECGQKLGEVQEVTEAQVVEVADIENIEEEQNCLDIFNRFLRFENKAWNIVGFVYLGFGAIYLFFTFIFFVTSLFASEDVAAGLLMAFGMSAAYFFATLMFMAVGVVNLIMASKTKKYISEVYTNVEPAFNRANSVGLIVLGYLFNSIAMAFFLVNFIRAKVKKKIFASIIRRQQGTL